LTDIDADGDTDREEDGLRAFDSTHSFFNPIGSPIKNRPHAPEVILVEDSDEEGAEDVSEVDDDEEDPTREDIDKVLRVERWITPKYAFALDLLRFMDPSEVRTMMSTRRSSKRRACTIRSRMITTLSFNRRNG
jgi:hypothetical protein